MCLRARKTERYGQRVPIVSYYVGSLAASGSNLDTAWDLCCFKQALQFQKPKTKGRQIWPPPWAAKGPATPLVLQNAVVLALNRYPIAVHSFDFLYTQKLDVCDEEKSYGDETESHDIPPQIPQRLVCNSLICHVPWPRHDTAKQNKQ